MADLLGGSRIVTVDSGGDEYQVLRDPTLVGKPAFDMGILMSLPGLSVKMKMVPAMRVIKMVAQITKVTAVAILMLVELEAN